MFRWREAFFHYLKVLFLYSSNLHLLFFIFFETFILFTSVSPFFCFASLDRPFAIFCTFIPFYALFAHYSFMLFLFATLFFSFMFHVVTTLFYCLCLLLFFSNNFSYTHNKTPIAEADTCTTVSFFWLLKHPVFNWPPPLNTVSHTTFGTLSLTVQHLSSMPFPIRYFPPNSPMKPENFSRD